MTDAVQVTTSEAQCFADKFQMPLFETSAKDDDKTDHVESIFLTLAHKLKVNNA
jgi:Ras-related protein Rab-33B